MFCPECGSQLAAGATACGNCGTPLSGAGAAPSAMPAISADPEPDRVLTSGTQPAAATGEDHTNKLPDLVANTLRLVKQVAQDPISGLSTAFESVSKKEALQVALLLIGINALLCALGISVAIRGVWGGPGASDFVEMFLAAVLWPAAIWGALVLARRVFDGQRGSLEGDCFITAFAVLPSSLTSITLFIFGVNNLELLAVPFTFALSYSVFVLYAGCTRVSGIPHRRAIPSVPLILLFAGLILRILVGAAF